MKYKMIFDMGDYCDGIMYGSFEQAKTEALELLMRWEAQEMESWEYPINPTEEQIESWDMMIFNFSVWVEEFDDEENEWIEAWCPSDDDLQAILWDEWNNIKERMI